jgi:hypothetical protein
LIGGVMMPKTVVSLAIWVFMFGLGAGLAGLLLFILYQTQINNLEGRIIDSQEELEDKLNNRIEELEKRPAAPQPDATLNVAAEAAERARNELVRSVAPAIVGIRGLDASGNGTNGTGFIVNTTGEGSWVVTNYQLVAGSRPETGVNVKIGPSEVYAELYEVDAGADLALVIVNVSGRKALRFTRGDLKPGDTVWVIGTARGSPYAKAVEARLVDYSPARVVVDVDPGAEYNGGPVIDASGRVVGVLSGRPPRPAVLRTDPAASPSPVPVSREATPIRSACNVILRCPGSRPSPAATPTAASGSPAPRSPRPSPSPEPPPSPAPSLADPANPFFQSPAN